MHSVEMKNAAAALDEAAEALEKLSLKYPQIFDELNIRYPLADELGGFAGMLREHGQTQENQAVDETQRAINRARGLADS